MVSKNRGLKGCRIARTAMGVVTLRYHLAITNEGRGLLTCLGLVLATLLPPEWGKKSAISSSSAAMAPKSTFLGVPVSLVFLDLH